MITEFEVLVAVVDLVAGGAVGEQLKGAPVEDVAGAARVVAAVQFRVPQLGAVPGGGVGGVAAGRAPVQEAPQVLDDDVRVVIGFEEPIVPVDVRRAADVRPNASHVTPQTVIAVHRVRDDSALHFRYRLSAAKVKKRAALVTVNSIPYALVSTKHKLSTIILKQNSFTFHAELTKSFSVLPVISNE